jgi:hypothetical protein
MRISTAINIKRKKGAFFFEYINIRKKKQINAPIRAKRAPLEPVNKRADPRIRISNTFNMKFFLKEGLNTIRAKRSTKRHTRKDAKWFEL